MIAAALFGLALNAPFVRVTVDVSEYGLHGAGTILVDRSTGRYSRRFDVGPASDGDGYDGRVAWMSDAGDAVYPQTNADTRARIMTWSHLLSRFGASPLPAHTTMRVGNDREEVTFTDVRRVDGVDVPFEIRDRDASGTRVIRVRRIVPLETVARDAFAPPSLPHDFGVRPSTAVATVPMLPERLGGRTLPLVVINARLNGGPPMRFLVDTGGQNIITTAAVKRLHLATSGSMNVGGTGSDSVVASFATIDDLSIGGAYMKHQSFMVLPLGGLLPDVDGIVGAELLSRFATRFDFEHQTFSLAPALPERWIAGATQTRIGFDKNMPDALGAIDGVAGRFTLDTGSVGGVDVNEPFAAQNRLYARYASGAKHGHVTGVGGTVQTARVSLAAFSLGTLALRNVPATLAFASGGVTSDPTIAGNIGERFFQHYASITFDYATRAFAIGLPAH